MLLIDMASSYHTLIWDETIEKIKKQSLCGSVSPQSTIQ